MNIGSPCRVDGAIPLTEPDSDASVLSSCPIGYDRPLFKAGRGVGDVIGDDDGG